MIEREGQMCIVINSFVSFQAKSAPISKETKEKGDSGLVLLPEDSAKIPLINTEPGVQSTLNLDQVSKHIEVERKKISAK